MDETSEISRRVESSSTLLAAAQHAFGDLFPSRAKASRAIRDGQVQLERASGNLAWRENSTYDDKALVSTLVYADDILKIVSFNAVDFVRSRDYRPLRILYEDDHVAVVWKDAGISTLYHGPSTFSAALPWLLNVVRPAVRLRSSIGKVNPNDDQNKCIEEELENDTVFCVKSVPLHIINPIGSGMEGCVLVTKTLRAYSVFQYEVDNNTSIRFVHRAVLMGSLSTLLARVTKEGLLTFNSLWSQSVSTAMMEEESSIVVTQVSNDTLHISSRLSTQLNSCTTAVRLIYETYTNNENNIHDKALSDGVLSTVDAYIVQGHPGRQIRQHCADVGLPVVGNTVLTRPLRSSKTNGMLMCLRSIEFDHPVEPDRRRVCVEFEEPLKFQTLRKREERFWQERRTKVAALHNEDISLTTIKNNQEIDHPILLAYTLGQVTFCNLSFIVTPAVMIPRISTELLVASALRFLQKPSTNRIGNTQMSRPILDLGTGSGNILLSVLNGLDNTTLHGYGIDISLDALAVAQMNTDKLGLTSCVTLLHGAFADLKQVLLPHITIHSEDYASPFEMVICNPPYHIAPTSSKQPLRKRSKLNHSVIAHEPALSLFADSDDGLSAYRTVCRSVAQLRLSDWLMFECANKMQDKVIEVARIISTEIMSSTSIDQKQSILELVEVVHGKIGSPKVVIFKIKSIS